MRMFLKRMHIQNFKGCKDRRIEFGNRTSIKGINGSGKTTIADAFMWVLFNKDSSGATNFDIRPKDQYNNDIDFIDIRVELVIDVDGREITLTKTQKQNWVKKRGAEEQTFQGNVNFYEINTIPKTEREFKEYIAGIIDEDIFKFVSNTNAFMAQKPMDRRKTLFRLVSDMTDADVLATDPKFLPLADQLAQFTSEEILSRDKKALTEYMRKLEEIPARIDEVSKSIVEQDYSEAEAKLQELREQLASIEDDTSDAAVYEEVNRFKAEITKLKGELADIEQKANAENRRKRNDIQQKIIDTDQQISSIIRAKQGAEREIEMCERDIPEAEKRLAELGEQYKAEKAKEISPNANICPTCHREYDADVKEKILADFEEEKEKQLYQINLKGKSVADTLKKSKEALERLKSKVFEYELQLRELNRAKEDLQKELENIPASVDVSTDPTYIAIQASLQNYEENLQAAQRLLQDAYAKKQAIADRKRAIQNEIDSVNRVLASRQIVAQAKARVEDLKTEQRQISQKIADVEKEIYLLEEFNKAKVNLLSEKINAHFKIVRWKLFERQINGGYNPVCEPMINGQAYSTALNSGHKILAELDIIQALQRIYDVSVPVFLDNAERINDFNIPEMDCQLITLSVTEDPELVVEVYK